jgi:hypothetical protein
MAFCTTMRTAIVLSISLSGWTASIAGCNLCGDDPVVRASSPGGRHELIVACVDCGATTTWVYQVRIARRRSWFPSQALVLAADAPGGCSAEEVRTAWLDESHVRVDFDGYIRRSYPVRTRVDGVDVDVRLHAQNP